jgi:hypothetical protein
MTENIEIKNIKINQIEENRKVKIPYLTYEDEDSSILNNKSGSKKSKIPVFDLNNIFKINFSYDFDLLKNLLESLINNQQETQKEMLLIKKESEIKINELERKIIDMKIENSDPDLIKELQIKKDKLEIESEKIKNKVLKEKNLPSDKGKYADQNLEVNYIFLYILIFYFRIKSQKLKKKLQKYKKILRKQIRN